ncbi:MAG: aldehyde dehydrogenase family protein [Burkholderiales bacterium]
MAGGRRLTEGALAKGYFVSPTVFADVDPGMRIAQEENFGPVVSMIPFDTEEEAVSIANGVSYGLTLPACGRATWAVRIACRRRARVSAPRRPRCRAPRTPPTTGRSNRCGAGAFRRRNWTRWFSAASFAPGAPARAGSQC